MGPLAVLRVIFNTSVSTVTIHRKKKRKKQETYKYVIGLSNLFLSNKVKGIAFKLIPKFTFIFGLYLCNHKYSNNVFLINSYYGKIVHSRNFALLYI